MRQDTFYWAHNGEEIDPKRVTIVRDKGEIVGYLVTEQVVHAPEDIKREPYCQPCDTDTHRCPGCGVPVEHGYPCCVDCALL